MKTERVSTGYDPRWFQRDIHQNLKRFSVLVLHRRAGKTVLAVNALIDAALRTQKKAARFGYVAPFRNQAKQIAWDYLKEYTRNIPGVKYTEIELQVEFANGARIRLFGADNPDAMRGLYFDGVVMDEVADMRPETWGEVVRPALSDRKGWCMFIGTPKGQNMFFELYQHALQDKDWYAGMFTVEDTQAIDAEELRQAKATMSDNQYRQEFLCDFSASVENVLITIDMVTEAAGRPTPNFAEALDGLPKVIGVDVARFGDDRSSIIRRHGPLVYKPKVFEGVDNMHLVGLIASEIRDFKPDAVFVDGGRGEGVIDRLRQLGYDVIEVQFGGRATNPRYTNKRAEMWDTMAQAMRDGMVLPHDKDLRADLVVQTFEFDAQNRLKLTPKEKLKEKGMRSPDIADALAVTYAFPVHTNRMPRHIMPNNESRTIEHDFDPY